MTRGAIRPGLADERRFGVFPGVAGSTEPSPAATDFKPPDQVPRNENPIAGNEMSCRPAAAKPAPGTSQRERG
jgi:hypothetical protein